MPPTGSLKTRQIYCFIVQEIRSPKSRCQQAHTPSETSRNVLPGLFLASSDVLAIISIPCLQMSNSSLSLHHHMLFPSGFSSFVNVCLSVQISPSDTDISQTEQSYLIRAHSNHLVSLVAQMVKHLPAMQETWVRSLGWEDPLEKEMATYSSTLAWKILWTEEPGRLQSMGSQRIGHDRDFTFIF